MEHIDVHDLPESDAKLVAAFVEFLRRERVQHTAHDAEAQEKDWAAGAAASFAEDWDNDEDAIYDNWQEHYHRTTEVTSSCCRSRLPTFPRPVHARPL